MTKLGDRMVFEWVEYKAEGNCPERAWCPVSPQPCCENCQKNYHSMPCGIAPGYRSRLGDKNFYCSVWEAKK